MILSCRMQKMIISLKYGVYKTHVPQRLNIPPECYHFCNERILAIRNKEAGWGQMVPNIVPEHNSETCTNFWSYRCIKIYLDLISCGRIPTDVLVFLSAMHLYFMLCQRDHYIYNLSWQQFLLWENPEVSSLPQYPNQFKDPCCEV